MIIHKINAIDSTNLYLRELASKNDLDNYTVISTELQHAGKGQGINIWTSQKGKNLLFSILIKHDTLKINKNPYLNFAISLGIYHVLIQLHPLIKIKWPNDIMAGSKKICGILIENTIKGNTTSQSIVGIGLNVNQLIFPKNIPNAISLKNLINKKINRDLLLEKIIISIKTQIKILESENFENLKINYEAFLYKKDLLSPFKNTNQEKFQGKIIGVSKSGLLRIEQKNCIQEFANKEIIFL